MRFFRRVLRASASAGESSSLRNSTLPFLPLRTLPSASAFSVRLADSRAAISPGEGLRSALFVLTLRPCLEALREFFRGFDVFLAMIVLRVGADAGRPRRLQSSLVGGARENFKL